jgi:hypothetical protein
MRLVTQWFCIDCSAIFESETYADTHPFCPRCGEDCEPHITIQCADDHQISDPNCPHVCTAAWRVNDLGYLYCSICRKENE